MIKRLKLLKKLFLYFSSGQMAQFSITRIPLWIIIVSLLLVVLVGVSGILNLHYLNMSHQEIEKINEIITLAQTTQIDFGNQLAIVHAILFENDNEEYRKYFHKFSYQYTVVQNELFNLKLMLDDYPAIKQDIEQTMQYHKQFSELLIDEITQYKEGMLSASDVYSIIKGKDKLAIDTLSKVCNDINTIASNKIIRTKNRYFTFSIISIIGICITSIILVVTILFIIKAEKRFLFSIGKQLSSFLPSQLVQLILTQKKQEIFPIQKKFLTVCFSDIQGFTKLTDTIEADIAAEILNEYLTEMTKIALKWNATVDKFLGDGIMILFGAPIPMTPALQAENSLYMAYEMLQTFKTLNVKWKNLYNINDIYLRIGIHCGIATVGSFGPEDRLSFTAIGKTVNIASRLEQACTEDSILISNDVKQLIPGVVVTQVQSLQIRGIEQHIDVYTINEPYSLNKPT